MENKKVYYVIDLKSFFASCECVERGLDPFKADLVVADPTRKSGTICLAVTPHMKSLGVKNRCRLFQIPKNIDYVIAPPRMSLYIQKSVEIYSVYLNYISKEDIHPYSIDECFIDATDYLKLYNKSEKEFAVFLMDKVFEKTEIRATCGIGTNMFLAKVALDITAKKAPDFIGILDEQSFKREISTYRPITDIWNVGIGTAKKLAEFGVFDLNGITKLDQSLLYRTFGINAELLIDHAKGIEPCTISDIKSYSAKTRSISNGQVLFRDYSPTDAEIILKEMVDLNVLELIENNLVTDNISLSITYSKEEDAPSNISKKLNGYTSSLKDLTEEFLALYNSIVKKNLMIRKINISFNNLKDETFESYNLFSDTDKKGKEKTLLKKVIEIKDKYGKNSILKGMNFLEGATQRERNTMIGGHKSGKDDKY